MQHFCTDKWHNILLSEGEGDGDVDYYNNDGGNNKIKNNVDNHNNAENTEN